MSEASLASDDAGSDSRDLREYLQVLRRRIRVIVIVIAATVGVALGVTLIQDDVYRAEAQVLIAAGRADSIFDPTTGQRNDPERALQTEIEVARSASVEQRVPEELRGEVTITSVSDTDVMGVRSRDNDPQRAAAVANAYAQAYIDFKREQANGELDEAIAEVSKQITDVSEQIAELDAEALLNPAAAPTLQQQRTVLVAQQADLKAKQRDLEVAASLNEGGARIISEGEAPTVPIEPQPLRTAVIAFGAALILAIGLAFLVDYLDDSITLKEDLERATGGLAVLGLIPVYEQRDRGPITLVSDWKSPAAESYRTLRTSIQFMGLDQPLHVLQVTSPNAAEGKTTTLANVGVALAGIGVRVVLIDLDLRRPRLHEVFNLENDVGFTSVLLGRAELDEALVPMLDGNDLLSVLPSGPIPPNPSELLSSPRVQKFLAEMRERADLVLIDSPPVLPVTDSMVVSRNADAVILVAAVGATSRRQVSRAVELLRQVGAPLAGTVLNRAGETELYGYGYGYGYGTEPPANTRRGRKARRENRRREKREAKV